MARGKVTRAETQGRRGVMTLSGVAWLGDIPEEWEVKRLKCIASCNDESLAEDTPSNFSFDYVDVGSVKYGLGIVERESMLFADAPSRARRVVRKDDVIVSTVRTYLKSVAQIPPFNKPLIVSTGFAVLRARNADAIFLSYALQSQSFVDEVEAKSTGISYPAINASDLVCIKVPVPPLPEQRAIADYLDEKCGAIDAAIAEAKKGIEEYKAWKKSLIFEAVTGKRRVGVFNAETQRRRGRREVEKMKPSGIPWVGAIPAGWRVVKASRLIASTQNGLTRRNLSESKGDIVLRLKNISPDGYIDYSDVVRIELSEKEKDTYCLTEGDLLFARVNGSRGLVGKCAVFVDNEECVAYNDHLIRVRVNGIVVRSFITYYLSSQSGRTEIELHTSTSAGQFTISGEGLRDIAVVLPPLPEQQAIADYLDEKCAAIDAMVAEKETLIVDLESYKKSLIYEVVTGKKEPELAASGTGQEVA